MIIAFRTHAQQNQAQATTITQEQMLARLEKLRQELIVHDLAYYGNNAPLISDHEYDELKAEILYYEQNYRQLVLEHFGELLASVRVGHGQHASEQVILEAEAETEASPQPNKATSLSQVSTQASQDSVSADANALAQLGNNLFAELTQKKTEYTAKQLVHTERMWESQTDAAFAPWKQKTLAHVQEMLSLGNVYEQSEFNEFTKSVYTALEAEGLDELAPIIAKKSITWCAEPKLDGIAVSITYENGQLVKAVTRGNGREGVEITQHVKRTPNVPQTIDVFAQAYAQGIPSTLEVRGEAIMLAHDFAAINQIYKSVGRQPMANLRNAAGGFISQEPYRKLVVRQPLRLQADLEPPVPGDRLVDLKVVQALPTVLPLRIMVYSVNQVQVGDHDWLADGFPTQGFNAGFSTTYAANPANLDAPLAHPFARANDPAYKLVNHYDLLMWARSLGFSVSNLVKLVCSPEEVNKYYSSVGAAREGLGFDIDGTVFKVNDTNLQRILGFTANSPKWAIAFKFPPTKARSKIHSVFNSVNRTGLVTPVAKIDPCYVGGVVVSSISLHNYRLYSSLDLHYDDTVVIYRGGEVIPQLEQAVKSERAPDARPLRVHPVCPDCGSFLAERATIRPLNADDASAHYTYPYVYSGELQSRLEINNLPWYGRVLNEVDGYFDAVVQRNPSQASQQQIELTTAKLLAQITECIELPAQTANPAEKADAADAEPTQATTKTTKNSKTKATDYQATLDATLAELELGKIATAQEANRLKLTLKHKHALLNSLTHILQSLLQPAYEPNLPAELGKTKTADKTPIRFTTRIANLISAFQAEISAQAESQTNPAHMSKLLLSCHLALAQAPAQGLLEGFDASGALKGLSAVAAETQALALAASLQSVGIKATRGKADAASFVTNHLDKVNQLKTQPQEHYSLEQVKKVKKELVAYAKAQSALDLFTHTQSLLLQDKQVLQAATVKLSQISNAQAEQPQLDQAQAVQVQAEFAVGLVADLLQAIVKLDQDYQALVYELTRTVPNLPAYRFWADVDHKGALVCTNPAHLCKGSAQGIQRYFYGTDGIDAKSIGVELINELTQLGFTQYWPDAFKLTLPYAATELNSAAALLTAYTPAFELAYSSQILVLSELAEAFAAKVQDLSAEAAGTKAEGSQATKLAAQAAQHQQYAQEAANLVQYTEVLKDLFTQDYNARLAAFTAASQVDYVEVLVAAAQAAQTTAPAAAKSASALSKFGTDAEFGTAGESAPAAQLSESAEAQLGSFSLFDLVTADTATDTTAPTADKTTAAPAANFNAQAVNANAQAVKANAQAVKLAWVEEVGTKLFGENFNQPADFFSRLLKLATSDSLTPSRVKVLYSQYLQEQFHFDNLLNLLWLFNQLELGEGDVGVNLPAVAGGHVPTRHLRPDATSLQTHFFSKHQALTDGLAGLNQSRTNSDKCTLEQVTAGLVALVEQVAPAYLLTQASVDFLRQAYAVNLAETVTDVSFEAMWRDLVDEPTKAFAYRLSPEDAVGFALANLDDQASYDLLQAKFAEFIATNPTQALQERLAALLQKQPAEIEAATNEKTKVNILKPEFDLASVYNPNSNSLKNATDAYSGGCLLRERDWLALALPRLSELASDPAQDQLVQDQLAQDLGLTALLTPLNQQRRLGYLRKQAVDPSADTTALDLTRETQQPTSDQAVSLTLQADPENEYLKQTVAPISLHESKLLTQLAKLVGLATTQVGDLLGASLTKLTTAAQASSKLSFVQSYTQAAQALLQGKTIAQALGLPEIFHAQNQVEQAEQTVEQTVEQAVEQAAQTYSQHLTHLEQQLNGESLLELLDAAPTDHSDFVASGETTNSAGASLQTGVSLADLPEVFSGDDFIKPRFALEDFLAQYLRQCSLHTTTPGISNTYGGDFAYVEAARHELLADLVALDNKPLARAKPTKTTKATKSAQIAKKTTSAPATTSSPTAPHWSALVQAYQAVTNVRLFNSLADTSTELGRVAPGFNLIFKLYLPALTNYANVGIFQVDEFFDNLTNNDLESLLAEQVSLLVQEGVGAIKSEVKNTLKLSTRVRTALLERISQWLTLCQQSPAERAYALAYAPRMRLYFDLLVLTKVYKLTEHKAFIQAYGKKAKAFSKELPLLTKVLAQTAAAKTTTNFLSQLEQVDFLGITPVKVDKVQVEYFGGKSFAKYVDTLKAKQSLVVADVWKSISIASMGATTAEELASSKVYPSLESVYDFNPWKAYALATGTQLAADKYDSTKASPWIRLASLQITLEHFEAELVKAKQAMRKAQQTQSAVAQERLSQAQADYYRLLTYVSNLRQVVKAHDQAVPAAVIAFFSKAENLDLLKQLEQYVKVEQRKLAKTNLFFEKTVAVTGTVTGLSRKQINEFLKDSGAKAASSVSAKTDYLIHGGTKPEPGAKLSNKAANAAKLGVAVMYEEEFLAIFNG